MAESQGKRATHDEVEVFVEKLRGFHTDLDPTEESAGSESSSGWNDLIGWIEEQDEEDTQGFKRLPFGR